MSRLNQVLAVFAFAVALTSATSYGQVSCNQFDVTSKIVDKKLIYSIQSDLPEDTRISVSVTRKYWRKGETKAYSFDFYSKDVEMKAARQNSAIDLSEGVLKKLVDRANEMNELAGRRKFTVERLDEQVRLRVVVTMNQKNPDFGEHNRDLSGSKVRQIGAYRGVKVIRYVSTREIEGKKSTKAPKKTAPRVKARDFEVDKIYIGRQRFELLSTYKPAKGTNAAIVGKGGRQSLIFVESRIEDGDLIWYRIALRDTVGGPVKAMGWVESQKFGRKKHREQEDPSFQDALQELGWTLDAAMMKKARLRGAPKQSKNLDGNKVIAGVLELDDGLSKEDAASCVARHAWEVLENTGGAAVVLKLARQGDVDAVAGEAWLLPKGVVSPVGLTGEHFDQDPKVALEPQVQLAKEYFVPRPKSLPVDSQVYVKKEGSFEVNVHSSFDFKAGAKSKMRVAKGTSGTIKEVRFFKNGQNIEVRYRVELEGNKSGWVPAAVVFTF